MRKRAFRWRPYLRARWFSVRLLKVALQWRQNLSAEKHFGPLAQKRLPAGAKSEQRAPGPVPGLGYQSRSLRWAKASALAEMPGWAAAQLMKSGTSAMVGSISCTASVASSREFTATGGRSGR